MNIILTASFILHINIIMSNGLDLKEKAIQGNSANYTSLLFWVL